MIIWVFCFGGHDAVDNQISQSIEIKAALGDAYRALIRRLTEENSTGDNKSMPIVLEDWPGGRWFRDLGNRQGHRQGLMGGWNAFLDGVRKLARIRGSIEHGEKPRSRLEIALQSYTSRNPRFVSNTLLRVKESAEGEAAEKGSSKRKRA